MTHPRTLFRAVRSSLVAAMVLGVCAGATQAAPDAHPEPRTALVYHCAGGAQMLVERGNADPAELQLTWHDGSERLTRLSTDSALVRYSDADRRLTWIDMPQQALLLETGAAGSRMLVRNCRR